MGLEIPCLYTNQVIQHIDCLLQHGGTNTIMGQSLNGTIEQAKVEIGVCGNVLTQPFDLYGYLLTDSWIKGVWQEVFHTSIHVIEQTESLKPKQDNDILLIEQFTSIGYSKGKMTLLNQCRVYLQVTTLSDLTSGDGCYLLPHTFMRHNP